MNSNSNSSIEKCACDDTESAHESDSSNCETRDKKQRMSLSSLGLNLRRGRSLHFTSKRSKKNRTVAPQSEGTATTTLNNAIKKFPKWGIKFNCAKREPKELENVDTQNCCRCTCYRRKEEGEVAAGGSGNAQEVVEPEEDVASGGVEEVVEENEKEEVQGAGGSTEARASTEEGEDDTSLRMLYRREEAAAAADGAQAQGGEDVQGTPPTLYLDCDKQARILRAHEMEQGVEPPANSRRVRRVQVLCSDVEPDGTQGLRRLQLVCPVDLSVDNLRVWLQNLSVRTCPMDVYSRCHAQADFIHCLVPDLLAITNCSFYWGKMDRYEAERLLDGKPEGTFLLRDSAQEEFLFSVSFRKYSRSLHARIEQWNHRFSFDSHDPNVYTSKTVCGLIEHYKDPSSCMFFEPMLTRPLHRNFTFPLQHLCRASIVSRLTYDNINQLQLPKTLKGYLKEYHYSQKVRMQVFDDDDSESVELRGGGTT